MKPSRSDITGVVLAGGRGRRMGGVDKGLMPFRGQPLALWALHALEGIADTVLISANRHREVYETLGYPVIADLTDSFDGPLAGVLSAMRSAETAYVMVVPCDSPGLNVELLTRLLAALGTAGTNIAVADDGQRLHPVVMLAESRLADDLEAYLMRGNRRVDAWVKMHAWVAADFSDCPEVLLNINTPEEMSSLQGGYLHPMAD